MYPLVLIGASLNEMYNQLDSELKKTVSINAGIEDSNLRASLDKQRNICKNTYRKLATGLDVYPIIFYIPSKHIEYDSLDYNEKEGVARIEDFNNFLELLQFPQNMEEEDIEDQLLNDEILSALEGIFNKIHSANNNHLNQKIIKQKIFKALINFTTTVFD